MGSVNMLKGLPASQCKLLLSAPEGCKDQILNKLCSVAYIQWSRNDSSAYIYLAAISQYCFYRFAIISRFKSTWKDPDRTEPKVQPGICFISVLGNDINSNTLSARKMNLRRKVWAIDKMAKHVTLHKCHPIFESNQNSVPPNSESICFIRNHRNFKIQSFTVN